MWHSFVFVTSLFCYRVYAGGSVLFLPTLSAGLQVPELNIDGSVLEVDWGFISSLLRLLSLNCAQTACSWSMLPCHCLFHKQRLYFDALNGFWNIMWSISMCVYLLDLYIWVHQHDKRLRTKHDLEPIVLIKYLHVKFCDRFSVIKILREIKKVFTMWNCIERVKESANWPHEY
jgi:hypothetical protein